MDNLNYGRNQETKQNHFVATNSGSLVEYTTSLSDDIEVQAVKKTADDESIISQNSSGCLP